MGSGGQGLGVPLGGRSWSWSVCSNGTLQGIFVSPFFLLVCHYINMDLGTFTLYFALQFSMAFFFSSKCSSFGHWKLFIWHCCLFDRPLHCRAVFLS